MAQTLLIGLGGTGSRVVNNVVRLLGEAGRDINNGEICCAVLDTNVNDNAAISASRTGVAVFSTSKAKKIHAYLDEYRHLNMDEWCPSSSAFLEESMIDGASELRVKSRIAFMDYVESGSGNEFELMINDMLGNNTGSKIRVMIVSSLSGGTGSGMFIQVALWLRKIFRQNQITIRGIFMLPDVFVSTIRDIRDNKATKVRHYCNAYAAIRELNAISKITKSNSARLTEEIALDSLFNSSKDKDSGKQVYDWAFFVDDKDENGVKLESIGDYERMVAQLVFMQLYAPMKDDMYSEEDNTFLEFTKRDEPLYGSCGTSKAVYPAASVKKYCAIRAAQDSLVGGWRSIDSEIDALRAERLQKEADGIFATDVFDPRAQFMKIFEQRAAVSADETGRDRFFLSISKDVKNETRRKQDDRVVIEYSDKAEDFIKLLKTEKIDMAVTRNSGTGDFAIDADAFVAGDHTRDELMARIRNDETGISELLDTFDRKSNEYADAIVGSVFPCSMGEVKQDNKCTVYGLLSKPDDMGTLNFIHPVAARYVLYKLVAELERALRGIDLRTSREEALADGDNGTLFDNKATAVTERTPDEYLNSRKWYQREETFLDTFEGKYAQYVNTKLGLCEKYDKELLQTLVFRKLIERLNGLAMQLESFFGSLGRVQEKLADELGRNIEETRGTAQKTIYIYGGRDEKESIYRSLQLGLEKSNAKINKGVIDAAYGGLCAQLRPSDPENAKYVKNGIVASLVLDTIDTFEAKIDDDPNNREKVNMNIYTALCKACDDEAGTGRAGADELDRLDIANGVVRANTAAESGYRAAFDDCRKRLHAMAAPFLQYTREIADNEQGTITTRTKTFWGFNPELSEACPYLGTMLGVNADLQSDDAYRSNELYCYRAVYGLSAAYIPKFNECGGGDYYRCYSSVIGEMVRDAEGTQGERAYVRTPHLDKKWHKILPYVTDEKQRQSELEFFHGFWLAVAYGTLLTNQEGNFVIKRSVDGGFGNFIENNVEVNYRGKAVKKNEIVKLIAALQTDKAFTDSDIRRAEELFAAEISDLDTYVGTKVLKGLTPRSDDLNPINIICRYNTSRGHSMEVSAKLIGALEEIARELAERYNIERNAQELEKAKYRICRKIYDSSKRCKGRSEIFGRWEEKFKEYRIKEEDSAGDSCG